MTLLLSGTPRRLRWAAFCNDSFIFASLLVGWACGLTVALREWGTICFLASRGTNFGGVSDGPLPCGSVAVGRSAPGLYHRTDRPGGGRPADPAGPDHDEFPERGHPRAGQIHQ